MVRAALTQGRSLGYCSSERFVAQSPCQLVAPWYLYVSPGMDELIVSAIWIGRVDVFDPRRGMPPGPLGDQQYGAPAGAFGGSGLPLHGPSVEKDGQVAVDVLNAGMMALHVQVSLFGTVPEEEAPSVSAPASVRAHGGHCEDDCPCRNGERRAKATLKAAKQHADRARAVLAAADDLALSEVELRRAKQEFPELAALVKAILERRQAP
jgi:hypothetical protein